MAKKRNILERTPEFGITLFDVLSKFDISKTNKFVDMLSRLYLKMSENKKEDDLRINYKNTQHQKLYEFKSKLTSIERTIFESFMCRLNLNSHNEISELLHFMYLIESKAVKDCDIDKYNTIDEVLFAVKNHEAEKIVIESWEYKKLFEDEYFLIVMPFTLRASQKYGAGTKWCTTSPDSTFYHYIEDGVLIYVIDKKTNNKIAVNRQKYDSPESIGFWNSQDKRVDSYYTKLPKYILDEVFNILNSPPTAKSNINLASEEVKAKLKEIKSTHNRDQYWGEVNGHVDDLEELNINLIVDIPVMNPVPTSETVHGIEGR